MEDQERESFESYILKTAPTLKGKTVIPDSQNDLYFYGLSRQTYSNIRKFAMTYPEIYTNLRYPSDRVPFDFNVNDTVRTPESFKNELFKKTPQKEGYIKTVKNLLIPVVTNMADVLGRGTYVSTATIHDLLNGKMNDIPEDVLKEVLSGIGKIKGRKMSFKDIFTEMGWKPTTRYEKIAKSTMALAADIFIDPTFPMKFLETPAIYRKLMYFAKSAGVDDYVKLYSLAKTSHAMAISEGKAYKYIKAHEDIVKLIKNNIDRGYTVLEPLNTLSDRSKAGAFAIAQFMDIPILPRSINSFIAARLEMLGTGLSHMPVIKPTKEWLQKKLVYGTGNKIVDDILSKIDDQTDYELMKEVISLRKTLGKMMPGRYSSIFNSKEYIKKEDWHIISALMDPPRQVDTTKGKELMHYLHGIWDSATDDRKQTWGQIVSHLKKIRDKYTQIDFDAKTYDSLLGIGGPGAILPGYMPHIQSPIFKEALSEVNSRMGATRGSGGVNMLDLMQQHFGSRKVEDLSILELNQLEQLGKIKIEDVLSPSKLKFLQNKFPGSGRYFIEDPIEASVTRFYRSLHNKNTAIAFEELVKNGKYTGVQKIKVTDGNSLRKYLLDNPEQSVYIPAGTLYHKMNKKGILLEDLDIDATGWINTRASDLDKLARENIVFDKLDEVYVMPKNIVSFLNTQTEKNTPKGLTRLLEESTVLWKAHTLFYFAGYHARNFLSNAMLMFRMGVTNPLLFVDATKLQMSLWASLRNLPPSTIGDLYKTPLLSLKETKIIDAFGKVITGEQFMEELLKRGVLGTGYFSAEFPGAAAHSLYKGLPSGYAFKGTQEALIATLGTKGALIQTGAKIGESIENNAKITLALWGLKKGYDFDEIARLIRFTLFRYDKLTPSERKIRATIIPFYSFERNNIEFQIRTHIMRPGRASMVYKAVDRAQREGKDPDGVLPDGIPMSILYDHIKHNLNIAVKETTKNGKKYVYYAILKTWVPESTIYEYIDGKNIEKKVISMLNPFLTVPYELFGGKRFSDADMAIYNAKPMKDKLKLGFISNIFPSKQGISLYSNDVVQDAPGQQTTYLGMQMSERMKKVISKIRIFGVINDVIENDTTNTLGKLWTPSWIFGNLQKVDIEKAKYFKLKIIEADIATDKANLTHRIKVNMSDPNIDSLKEVILKKYQIYYGDDVGKKLYDEYMKKKDHKMALDHVRESVYLAIQAAMTDKKNGYAILMALKKEHGAQKIKSIFNSINTKEDSFQ